MTGSFDRPTIVHSLSSDPYIELDNQQGQKLKINLTKNIHQLGRDPEWSDLKLPETGWQILSRKQAVLVKEGKDYRIYDGDRTSPSRNGMFVQQTRINLSDGYPLKNGLQIQIGQDPCHHIFLTYNNPTVDLVVAPSKRNLVLKGLQDWPVEIGRAPSPNYYSSFQLDAPTVSRLHATIYPDAKGGHVLQDSSTNGTFVNSQRVDKRQSLEKGDTIQIGPFTLLYTREALELNNANNQIRLDVHNLLRQVKDKQGIFQTILDRVSLAIEPGQLVALVGGSGTGKSTLMKSLLGIEPLSSGNVYLNGDDLHKNWAIYRSQIGYVPQDDIIHEDLSVKEVLFFACKLRLPPDIDAIDVVNRTLEEVKLTHVKDSLVRNLSGGQRKRVSMAVELLADPKLFFLDEPTSGLDPGLDKEMMNLLKDLANRGRTVILVTHATANIEVCDRIAFMGRGGKLCYFGPPKRALSFFEMPSEDFKYFSDIYIKLDRGFTTEANHSTVTYWFDRYLHSPEYQLYIQASLSPGKNQDRQKVNRESNSSYSTSHGQAAVKTNANSTAIHTGISPLKQLLLLSQRYSKLVWRDQLSLLLSLISGPITIALAAICLQGEKPLTKVDVPSITQASLALRLLFIFSCVGIWVGLSNSVREIVKESAIYWRERLLNLGLLPYLGSKLLIRSSIACLQTILITITVLLGFDRPETNQIPWSIGLGITIFLTLFASTSLSLMISAAVKTENEANSILPMVMIPQIIFSGVLFDLDGVGSKLSWLMLSRWSIGAFGSLADVNSMAAKLLLDRTGESFAKIFEETPVYAASWENLILNWQNLCIHTLVYSIVTLVLLKRKDLSKN